MRVWLINALLAVSICAAVAFAGAAADFWWIEYHAGEADLTAIGNKLNAALDTVNRPCSPGPCGTLANLDKLTVKVGDLAVTSQLQEAHVGQLVTATASNLDTVGDSVKQVAGSLSGTATAATGLLQTTQGTVDSLRVGLAPLYPQTSAFLSHSDAAMTDLDSRINEFKPLESNLTSLTGSMSATAADFHVWSSPFLNPKPCTDFKCRFGRTGWPLIKDVLGLGADANQVRILLGNPLPVTLK